MSTIREHGDLNAAVNAALKELVLGLGADRLLVWQVVGDQLTVTHEHSEGKATTSIIWTRLDSRQSTQLVLNFLDVYPYETGSGIIEVHQGSVAEVDWTPYLSIFETVPSHLLVQLRAGGIFMGFLALQSQTTRQWSTETISTMENISAFLSVLFKDSSDLERVTMDARELNAMVEISTLFLAEDASTAVIALRSVAVIAEELGLKQSRLYLYDGETLSDVDSNQCLDLSDKTDAFVEACDNMRGMFIGPAFSHSSLPNHFADHSGLIMPLIADEKLLGVFGVWEFRDKQHQFRPQDRELALWISSRLANCIAAARSKGSPKM